MKSIERKIYFFAILVTALFFIYALSTLDWSLNLHLLLAMVFAILSLLLAIYNPKYLFLLIVIILPSILKFHNIRINLAFFIPNLKYYSLPINPTAFFSFLLIFISLVSILTRWKKIKNMPLKLPIVIYGAILFISFFWSLDMSYSLIGVVYLFTPLVACLGAFIMFSSPGDLILLIRACLLSAVFPMLLATTQFFQKDFFYETNSSLGRLAGPFVHPNLFSFYLFIVLALLAIYFFSQKNKSRTVNLLVVIYAAWTGILLLLTYSRISWACLAIFLLIYSHSQKIVLIWMSLITPITAVITFYFEPLKYRIMEIFQFAIFNSWIARKNIWEVGWEEFTKKPILGHGVGTSELIIDNAKPWRDGSSLPHNDLIQHLVELGLVGLFSFIFLMMSVITTVFKKYTSLKDTYSVVNLNGEKLLFNFRAITFGLCAIFLSALLANLFDSAIREIVAQVIVWSLVGSVLAQKSTTTKGRA